MTFRITISFPVDEVNAPELEQRLKLAGMEIDRADHRFGVIHGRAEEAKLKDIPFIDGVSFMTSHGAAHE